MVLALVVLAIVVLSGCTQPQPECQRHEDCFQGCEGPKTPLYRCEEGLCSYSNTASCNQAKCGAECDVAGGCDQGLTCNIETCECEGEAPIQCAGEGEAVPVIASAPSCCLGLELIRPYQPDIVEIAGYCTANCGNGVCDGIETHYNCPSDCKENYCGLSTMGLCQSDGECVEDGCSGQICRSTQEEPIDTTCEYLECFDKEEYGVECRCFYGSCQWSPTSLEAYAKQFCLQGTNEGAYICGDYIKVVSSLEGEGIRFVTIDEQGILADSVECPVVAPDLMSEECRQLMELECGAKQEC